MTAKDLLADPLSDIHGAIAAWERDGRAFLGFADWFYERGMEAQGRAWEWVARLPDIDDSNCGAKYADGKKIGGRIARKDGTYYVFCSHGHDLRLCLDAPGLGWSVNHLLDKNYANLVCQFLDRWAEVFGTSPAPLEEVAA